MVGKKSIFIILVILFALPIAVTAESNEWVLIKEIEIDFENAPTGWDEAAIDISNDGDNIGVIYGDNYSIYETSNYGLVLSESEIDYKTSDAVFSPEDEYAALSYVESPGNLLEVADATASGKEIVFSDGLADISKAYSVSWSQEDIIAVAAGGKVHLFNVSDDDPNNWNELDVSPLDHIGDENYAVAFSDSGSELASGGPNSSKVWDTSDWSVIDEDDDLDFIIYDIDYSGEDSFRATGDEDSGFYSIEYVGDIVVFGSSEGSIGIYDASGDTSNVAEIQEEEPLPIEGDLELIQTIEDTEDEIYDLAFDGNIITSISGDGYMRIYDQVDSVEIEPSENQTITAGDEIDFRASASDSQDNLITEEDSEFTWENTNGTGLFDETTAGEYQVTAEYGGVISEPTTVTVEPADTDLIEAENVTETVGVEGEIIVVAEDEFGNVVEGENITVDEDDGLSGIEEWMKTDSNGIATFTFNETNTGEYTVEFSAEDSTIKDNSTVTIEDLEGPEIDITSPEGGEVFYIGDEFQIKWETEEGDGSIPEEDSVVLALCPELMVAIDCEEFAEVNNTGSHVFTVEDIEEGNYSIEVTVEDENGLNDSDKSDMFTIKIEEDEDLTTTPVTATGIPLILAISMLLGALAIYAVIRE